MKHFKLIQDGIDTRPYLDEISANAELWSMDTSRQEKIVTQRETQAITLRSHATQASIDSRVRRAKPIGYRGQPSAMASRLPLISGYVDELVRSMDGKMGRVVMTNLRPHGTIHPHTDDGLYWLLRDRYHLVLKSVAGSHFKAGGEEVRMQQGQLWWFDPTVLHEAFNDSEEDRIHVIVDVLSPHSMKTFRDRLTRAPLKRLRAFADAAGRGIALAFRERFLASPGADVPVEARETY
jgi:aspartyl/asparaginyl beta-hydroxylase